MSKQDLHPTLRHQASLDGWSQHGDVDFNSFATHTQAKMVLHGPAERMKCLNQLDSIIGADDGATLRSKSQLAQLRRKLSHTHESMLKAGR
jgi:hypothetical protein